MTEDQRKKVAHALGLHRHPWRSGARAIWRVAKPHVQPLQRSRPEQGEDIIHEIDCPDIVVPGVFQKPKKTVLDLSLGHSKNLP